MTAATSIPVRAAATSIAAARAEFEADRDPRMVRLRLRGIETALSTVRANLAGAPKAAARLGEVAQRCHGAAAAAGTHSGTAVPAELLAVLDVIDRCARLVVLGLPDLAAERLPLLHLATEAEQILTRWSPEPPAHDDDRALARELLRTVHAFLALGYPVR
ncbi:hypothetical protein [Nocardia sp. NPDC057353]|uniref:hypothetical protein n=1 Tax=Nocardia sp. NPDC057353 TaxID=3346104 RepID=UPI00362AA96F